MNDDLQPSTWAVYIRPPVTEHHLTGDRLEGKRARHTGPHNTRNLCTFVFEGEVYVTALSYSYLGYLPAEKKLRKARLEDIIEEARDFGDREICLS